MYEPEFPKILLVPTLVVKQKDIREKDLKSKNKIYRFSVIWALWCFKDFCKCNVTSVFIDIILAMYT